MNYKEINSFIKRLKNYDLTTQQKKMLKGQALAGDLDGAIKGLHTIIKKVV